MVAVGTVAFASLYLIREWRRGLAVYGGGYRPGWVLGDSNYFTVAALAILPIAFELLLVARRRWEKLYCIGCMLLIFFTITIGASRGGFLGIAIIIVYLAIRSTISRKQLTWIMIILVPFLALAPNSPIQRFISPAPGDVQSVDKHLLGWIAGLNMLREHPFFGVGLGNYKLVVVKYDTTGLIAADPHIAHNAYLEIAAEMGIPAVIAYLLFLGTTFLSLETTRKRLLVADSRSLAAIALGMQASLLGTSVAIFFVSGQYTRIFWLVLIMSMCLPALVPKQTAKKRPPRKEQPIEDQGVQVSSALIEMP